MTVARATAGGAVALLLTAALVTLSTGRWLVEPSADALLRLSWRAVGERVEECREATEAELAALPVHMRQKEICDARLVPFRLAVELDGLAVVDREVHAAGAREDRPTYVLEEIRVAPGWHHVRVLFAADRGVSPRAGDLPPLRVEGDFELRPRTVTLITRDANSGSLVALDADSGQ